MIMVMGKLSSSDYKGTKSEKELVKELVIILNEDGYFVGEELKEYIKDCIVMAKSKRGKKSSECNIDKVFNYLENDIIKLRDYRKKNHKKYRKAKV